MKKYRSLLFVFFLFLTSKSISQSFELSAPRIEFDGSLVSITYDIVSEKSKDLFFTWVEIEKASGEKISAKDLTGDVGPNVRAGANRKITWKPDQDSVNLLEEEVFIEVKAEKYIKSFNKGSVMLQSLVLPGWGQSKVKGSPWYITGIVLYGTAIGGYLLYNKSNENYDLYKIELDADRRADLYNKAQNGLNLSSVMMYTAAAGWLANLIWMAVMPNPYKPLEHKGISLKPVADPDGNLMLSLKLNF